MAIPRRFKQVDVFGSAPLSGNPLAVIMDAEGLSDGQMRAIARWTNLSETTFVLPPTDAAADYRVRIFTPDTEFPFAGHPTLGTAFALLEAGVIAPKSGRVVQECGVGLVEIEVKGNQLAFRSPEAQFRDLPEGIKPALAAALPGGQMTTIAPQVVEMGIKWLLVNMANAEACLAVSADPAALADVLAQSGASGVTLFGRHPNDQPAHVELRALVIEQGALMEDPVTGSANACLAQWLKHHDFALDKALRHGYRVRQGTCKQRDGRVEVTFRDGAAWVGGQCHTLIDGQLTL